MKVLIISDIHDNQINLKKCLTWCRSNDIASIFCCGDITNRETLEILSRDFKNKIYLVRGNAELYREEDLKKLANIKNFGIIANFKFGKYDVGLCHQPYLINKVLEKKPEIIFYGHTHKPWIEDQEGVKIINPGTLGGMFQLGTFAVWDAEKTAIELFRVENL